MKLGKGEVDTGLTIEKTLSNGEVITIQKPFAVENGDEASIKAFDSQRNSMYKEIIRRKGASNGNKKDNP